MRIGICGLLGSGKTLLQTILGYVASENDLDIYSNYKTTFSEMINPMEFLRFELENCCVLVDEMETVLDSRVNRRANRLLTYFVLQSRKRDVHIIYTSQLLGAVDLRLRFMSEINILAESYKRYFEYSNFVGGNIIKKFRISREKAKPFYDMYDTTEIILPVELMSNEIIEFSTIKEYVETLPTKKSFQAVMKVTLPFMSGDMISGAYDLIKVGKVDEAKRVLNF